MHTLLKIFTQFLYYTNALQTFIIEKASTKGSKYLSRFHFIFNPIAGNGQSRKVFSIMEALLKEKGLAYSVSVTEHPGHARMLAQEASSAGHSCIIAVGGDGTAREVAEALVHTDTPMSVLPCGTGNDLVRVLHIPKEPAAFLDMLLTHAPQKIDVGSANDTIFLNVAGFGFDVDVVLNMIQYKTRFNKGMTAYLLGLARALLRLRTLNITVDTGEERISRRALLIAAGNGTHFGGGMNVTPKADPQDGLLDICLISDVTRRTVLRVLTKFVKGKHLPLSYVTYFRAKEITVTSEQESKLQLDGEIMLQTPVTFRILPAALSVIMGK